MNVADVVSGLVLSQAQIQSLPQDDSDAFYGALVLSRPATDVFESTGESVQIKAVQLAKREGLELDDLVHRIGSEVKCHLPCTVFRDGAVYLPTTASSLRLEFALITLTTLVNYVARVVFKLISSQYNATKHLFKQRVSLLLRVSLFVGWQMNCVYEIIRFSMYFFAFEITCIEGLFNPFKAMRRFELLDYNMNWETSYRTHFWYLWAQGDLFYDVAGERELSTVMYFNAPSWQKRASLEPVKKGDHHIPLFLPSKTHDVVAAFTYENRNQAYEHVNYLRAGSLHNNQRPEIAMPWL